MIRFGWPLSVSAGGATFWPTVLSPPAPRSPAALLAVPNHVPNSSRHTAGLHSKAMRRSLAPPTSMAYCWQRLTPPMLIWLLLRQPPGNMCVEKPLTLTVNSAKRAVEAAKDGGVVLQVGHNKRRQPANRRLKEMIDGGELGTVTMIETHQSVPNALGFAPDYWRANRTESPLGGMTSLGVHMIDTMTYLLGKIETVFVFSKGIADGPKIDYATTIIFEFGAGPLGYLGTSFVVPRVTRVTVRGTHGTAINDVDGTRMLLQRPQDVAPDAQPIDSIDTIADQIDEFVRSIRGETTPETGGVEGQEVVAVLETAIASSESRRPEAVADFR